MVGETESPPSYYKAIENSWNPRPSTLPGFVPPPPGEQIGSFSFTANQPKPAGVQLTSLQSNEAVVPCPFCGALLRVRLAPKTQPDFDLCYWCFGVPPPRGLHTCPKCIKNFDI